MIRCFAAIPVPEPLGEGLLDILPEMPGGHPVSVENLHLTLAFFGEQPDAVLEELHRALEEIEAPTLTLTLDGLSRFGGGRALAANVQATPNLAHLREKVRGAARRAEIELRRERFRPHITLARFPQSLSRAEIAQGDEAAAKIAPRIKGQFEATRFTLTRSTLGKHGPVYDALARYPLG